MNLTALTAFGRRYARAWCSQDPHRVASFFAEDGSLAVNDDPPAVGRDAIAEVARSFMTTFPDLHLSMKGLLREGRGTVFHWSLIGNNTAPGGKGHRVQIDGHDVWRMTEDGQLIAESKGRFNASDYAYQLEHGVSEPPDEDDDAPVAQRGRPQRRQAR